MQIGITVSMLFDWFRARRTGLWAGVIFFMLAAVFHSGSVIHPATHAGGLSDELENAYVIWWGSHWLSHPWEHSFFQAPFFAPHDNTLAYSEHTLGPAMMMWPVTANTDTPLISLNLLFVLSTALTGGMVWMLVRTLQGSVEGAYLAGMIAALAPTRLLHAPGHLIVLTLWWIPVALIGYHRFRATNQLRWLALLGASVIAQGLFSLHGLLFMLVILAVVAGVNEWRARGAWRRCARIAIAVCMGLVVLSPLLAPYVRFAHEPTFVRSQTLRERNAPSFADMIAPPALLPVVSVERSVAPGLIALLMLGMSVGVLPWYLRKGGAPSARVLRSYGGVVLVGVLLACGPVMRIVEEGRGIPGPYALLGLLPGFSGVRAVGRFSQVALLGIGLCVGLLWRTVVLRMKVSARMATIIVGALLFAEYFVTAPSTHALDPLTLAPRAVDEWLAPRAPGCMVAELPFDDFRTEDIESVLFMYHQRFHGKRLVNGYHARYPPGYLDLVRVLSEPDAAARIPLLRAMGVDYLLLHTNMFPESHREIILRALRARTDVAEETRFSDTYVFRLSSSSVPCP